MKTIIFIFGILFFVPYSSFAQNKPTNKPSQAEAIDWFVQKLNMYTQSWTSYRGFKTKYRDFEYKAEGKKTNVTYQWDLYDEGNVSTYDSWQTFVLDNTFYISKQMVDNLPGTNLSFYQNGKLQLSINFDFNAEPNLFARVQKALKDITGSKEEKY